MDRQLLMLLLIMQVTITHFVQKLLSYSKYMYTYSFEQIHMIWWTVHVYSFIVMMYVFHSVQKKITCMLLLYIGGGDVLPRKHRNLATYVQWIILRANQG